MVLGEKETVIYGKGYIEDTLCGCTFRISPKSFYQVNPVQTEILYTKAIEYAGLTGKERIVDAYCGIGTIGLIAASKAKEVISVELNRDAVRDAVTNAKRNDIKNVQFYNADAGQFMVEMAEYRADQKKNQVPDATKSGKKATPDGNVDVVFMDPPRAGSDEAFLSSVIRLAPKRVVYISCNPETPDYAPARGQPRPRLHRPARLRSGHVPKGGSYRDGSSFIPQKSRQLYPH